MEIEIPRRLLEIRYYAAAQDYLRRLRREHIREHVMEATPQATQRMITVESLHLVEASRSDFHLFNELLVQYPRSGKRKPGQVVPDNMVALHDGPIRVEVSFDVPLQPARPFWMLEYVSETSQRKDYYGNLLKYEHELKVPYCLIFAPNKQELILYQHTGAEYVTVLPNEHGRLPLPEVELEVSLLDNWVRYWQRGELLPLPPDLLKELQRLQEQLKQTQKELQQAQRQRKRAGQQRKQAEQQQQQEKQQRELAEQRAAAAETALAQMQAELERLRRKPNAGK